MENITKEDRTVWAEQLSGTLKELSKSREAFEYAMQEVYALDEVRPGCVDIARIERIQMRMETEERTLEAALRCERRDQLTEVRNG